jgi:hypothetical protein|tara:strand:- start:12 stop:440 length:429 start_codon:yes stop_codon:yes gene_type:complete
MEKFERAINGTIEQIHEQFGIEIECWVNDIYEVWVYRKKNADSLVHNPLYKGKCTYISIKRKDKKAVHDWRHFQQIKNELVGDEVEAIELYPKESRLHDTVNQYHLFCLPLGTTFKFGWQERNVDFTPREGGYNKAGQRGLD